MIMTCQLDSTTALLQHVETAVVLASGAPAIIRDYFKKNPGVRFSTVWAEFKKRFFEKSENAAAEVTYCKYKLLQLSADGPIVAELGGETKAEATFTAAFALLKRQPRGETGFLQTNGYANIFYIRDKNGTLCAVRIGWADDGWVIDAISVQDPLAWNGKHEIFCPL